MRKTRKISHKIRPAYALVVDGETELWYLNMLKRNEPTIRVNIKPEIPSKKSIKDLFKLVLELLDQEYTKVFWIIDLDTLLKEANETRNSSETQLYKLLGFRDRVIASHPAVEIIINNPCLEFWFLLHFEQTSKQYTNCLNAEKQLKKYLADYQKNRKYFTKQNNDIYIKLRPFLMNAIANSRLFGFFDNNNPQKALSEMKALFESKGFKGHF
ncbi:MAG TPA: RloB family protein [Candidatus Sphingobacterium stercoripullorum]|nr:RloB family protein [Candidatus Sphingobacterium stercoripullorum]